MDSGMTAELNTSKEHSPDLKDLVFTSNAQALQKLSKEELLRLIELQKGVLEEQSKKVAKTDIEVKVSSDRDKHLSTHESPKTKKSKRQADFDFSRYKVRHVALKFLYLGWDHRGYVVQEDTNQTIEAVLFEALLRTKLLKNREQSTYHRCGRTDKGVSAFSQVVTLNLRSNLSEGVGIITPPGFDPERARPTTEEIDYVKILNRVLPPEIRVTAWAPVDIGVSARFSCTMRTYRYFFPRGRNQVDLMNTAARRLEGVHDFRNLCKMDVGNGVVKFIRTVQKAWIEAPEKQSASDMCCFFIQSNAFLWHQIRCILAVLFLVGEGKESPDIVTELLNVEKNPRKPQYSMASEIPLCLYDAQFDSFAWIYSEEELNSVIDSLVRLWTTYSVKSSILSSMIADLSSITNYRPLGHADSLSPGPRSRHYKPLFERQTCESLESRIEHYDKKRSQQS